MNEMLKLIRKNGVLPMEEMAIMLGVSTDEAQKEYDILVEQGIIKGVTAVVDYNDNEYVEAIIELNVQPRRDSGFDSVAETISRMKEVDTVYLMSGSYDLMVKITGKTFQEIALMTARKLSTIDGVTGTKTLFMLKKYKESGFLFNDREVDKREMQ